MAPRSSGSSRPSRTRRTRTSTRAAEPEAPLEASVDEPADDVEMLRAEEFVEELDRDVPPATEVEPPARRSRSQAEPRRGRATAARPRRSAAEAPPASLADRDEEQPAESVEGKAPASSRHGEDRRPPQRAAAEPADSDDDFGQGIDTNSPPSRPVRPVPEVRKERDDDSARSGDRDAGPRASEAGTREFYSYGLDEPGPDEAGPENRGPREGEGGGGYSNAEGDGPRRRRRRRRRGGRQDGPGQPQGGPGGGGPGGQHRHRRPMQNGRGRPQDREPRVDRDRERDGGYAPNDNAPSIGVVEGVLEMHPKGYGFLRDTKNNYAAAKTDPFVPGSIIEKLKLREGILIKGEICSGNRGQGPRLRTIEAIDGGTVEHYQTIKDFDTLTAINPFEQIKLETGPQPITMRVMDLLTPIGKGQRALIVAPPRTGKTMLMQDIANAVSINHPEIHLIVLLIDERPEEVTDMQRKVRGEVIASSMDRDVESHVRISQLIFERGKRLAESGKDVFILLDSITRTARAFNKWIGNSGRTGTGGLDVKAMDIPRKMFGTARRFDEGGSLTVAATALIDTGSAMDQAIFQEFKGTGNMEMVLNRALADRRIWPAIDIKQSGTRREEKILSPEDLADITVMRRSLVSLDSIEAMEQLTKTLGRFPSNREFLTRVRSLL